MTLDAKSLKHWIPYKLTDKDNEVFCEWLYVGDKPFEEPFFDETISICKRLPENRERHANTTSVRLLREWSQSIEAVPPAAFIFHVSRCGSTMVSQLLATRKDLVVLSEIPFFDEVLRAPKGYGETALFPDALRLYSQERTGVEKKAFIKLDSWHIVLHKEIRAMFPQVPFILLYRAPDEVLRSLKKLPGMHCIPQFVDPEFLGIQEKIITGADFHHYPTRVIERYLQTYLEVTESDSNASLFNYNQGLPSIIKEIGNITGISFSEEDEQKMKERLPFHSKNPGMYFSEEPIKQTRDEGFTRVFEWYQLLESARKKTSNQRNK